MITMRNDAQVPLELLDYSLSASPELSVRKADQEDVVIGTVLRESEEASCLFELEYSAKDVASSDSQKTTRSNTAFQVMVRFFYCNCAYM